MNDNQTAAQAETTASQVDAIAVISGLTAEIATLTQRAVIAEAHVIDLEKRLQAAAGKEKK